MCRGVDHGGRRCPGDNSANRLKRYHNRKLKGIGASFQEPRQVSEVGTLEAEESPQKLFDRTVGELEGYLATERSYLEHQAEILESVKLLGRLVQQVASDEFGGPEQFEIEDRLAWVDKSEGREVLQCFAEYEEAKERRAVVLREHGQGDQARIRLNEIDPALFSSVVDDEDETRNRWLGAKNEYAKALDEARAEVLSDRAAAYRKAFESLGVPFHNPDGDPGLVLHDTTKAAAKVMSEALVNVPQKWVEASNALTEETGRPLRVAQMKRRAHYQDHKRREKMVIGTSVYRADQEPGWEPKIGTWDQYRYSKTPPPGTLEHAIGDLGPNEWYVIGLDVFNRYDYKHKDGVPTGPGWFEAEVHGSTYWVRYKRRAMKATRSSEAELTVPTGRADDGRDQHSVALHEFSHRTENSITDLRVLEQAFLEKRRGDSSLEWLGPGYGKHEMAYRDNFANPYMGKVYEHGDTEITSMGMEALFHGKSGGFMGEQADAEYQEFLLGAIAYTGKG